ncbi:hypothetical protein HELRODRAFT_185082 [Helobdella robusta]|uniref:AAA+ ATPase domain-containing protein n=1 Tax=Helobdella robusta TaxID=6412 RepID=T1FMD5_HELRO|nr:hypothetical protein HELRODRAFT_185082 [Helobdella robusta]ESN96308.1 hypothetical protein HELRODRAFT_185082 [Helobdella robusta]
MKTDKPDKPWVEKYRPKCISNVAHQDEVVACLKQSFISQELPNLLFYGPPGTGKTSTILALARELFGDMFRERVLELNASDERGINVVREKIKNFSQISVSSSVNVNGEKCPPLKIVILDEADSMTGAAQAALRRIMEKECKSTRFCLICNYVTKIIEPLTSRCAKFRFKPLPTEVLTDKLKEICQKENVNIDEEALKTLIDVSDGDMRKAITTLQTAARMSSCPSISNQEVIDIAGVLKDEVISEFMAACASGSHDVIQQHVKDFILDGKSVLQLLFQLHDNVVSNDSLSDQQKSIICEKMGIVDKCLMEGADEYLQLLDLASVLMESSSIR